MKTEYSYQVGDLAMKVVVERVDDAFRVTVGERSYLVRAQRPEHGRLDLQVDDRRLRATVAMDGAHRHVALAGQTWVLERIRPERQGRARGAGGPASGSLEASMPGLVLDVPVAEGDAVQRGETLVVLEAMKMELRITAPADGVVARVHCKAGDLVERGQLLVEIGES